jgi:hypothetical protein
LTTLITKRDRRAGLVVLGLILLAQVVANLSLLSSAAHSGQVAIPWMMNRGLTLFGAIWEQHAPLTSLVAAAAQRVLPTDPLTVDRLLHLVLVLSTTLLVYRLAFRLSGRNPAAAVAAAGWWFLWQPVFGSILFYFDAVLGALFCAALLVWVEQGTQRPRGAALAAGLLMGLATLAKQHAWAGLMAFALWLLVVQRRALWPYVAGALVFPLLALLVVALQGNLESYLYWSYGYNLSGLMPGERPDGDLVRQLILSAWFVPAFALMALATSRRALGVLTLLLWVGAALTLVPRIGGIHAIGQLPLAAVMTGVVAGVLIAPPLRWRTQWLRLKTASPTSLALGGVLLVALVATVVTAIVPYTARPLGAGQFPAYDEFRAVGERVRDAAEDDATLFVLPLTDTTPQVYPHAGLLPPGTWVKGWSWYWDSPRVPATLTAEWAADPPDYVVVFRDILQSGKPGIWPFVDFVEANYTLVDTVPDVPAHGDAEIWRLNTN